MTEIKVDNFFTEKHKRLSDLATIAKYAAWIVLIVFFFYAGINLTSNLLNYLGQKHWLQLPLVLWNVTAEDWLSFAKLLIKAFSLLMQGIVYFLVLRGVYMGLNMIVEIDLNYVGKLQEDNRE